MFSSFEDWSVEHIRSVFEAKSEDECRSAIENTFTSDIEFVANGAKLNLPQLTQFVLTMVTTSDFKLKVVWQSALETPRDALNRDGALGGHYIIYNVRKAGQTATFERHKFVNVLITSQVADSDVDTRKISWLSIAATDKQVQ